MARQQTESTARVQGEVRRPAPLLTTGEAADYLNLPASWVGQEARAKRLPCVELGRYRRFRVEDLERWIDSRVSGPRR